MEQSTNFNFNLPSKSDETPADIDLISDNFRTVDDVVKQVQDDVSKMPTNLVNGSAEGSLRGINARAEGNGYTMGRNAVAVGFNTTASGNYSHAEGHNTSALGDYSHAEGIDTSAGERSHAEGSSSNASGAASHAEGVSTTASGNYSHAEGYTATASGEYSHAEGRSTTASGNFSHAEGVSTTASGECSHAEGYITTSSGEASHAEGQDTTASGNYSHAEGLNTIASSYCQHAQGKFNIEDTNNRYAHIVGNGEDGENRSNAHTLDWDGNAWFSGDVYVGGTSQDDENATKLSSVATDITQVKEKLDGIEEGANKTIVDSELSDTSTNPLQNKVVTEKINSANSTITSINSALDTKVDREVAIVGSDEANSAGWYKVADGTMPKTSNLSMMFIVHSTFLNKQYSGILQLDLYCASSGNTYCHQLGWLVRNGFDTNQVIVTIDGSNWAMYFNVSTSQYYRTFFEVMQKSSTKSSLLSNYTLYTDSVVETTEPTATCTSSDLGVIKTIFSTKADIETGTCTLTAYSDTVFGGTVSNEILLNWARDTSKYYTTGSTNSDGTLTVQGTGNARIINAYNINATGTVGVEFAVSGTGAIKIEIKGGGKIYTSGNISLSTNTQKIQITHATSGITVLNDVEINIYASGETSLKIENLLKMTEASTRTLTGNYDLIGNQVTVSVLVDNLQNDGEITLYPLPFVPKFAKSGVCGAFSSSSYSSAIYYDIDGTTARIYLNDAPQTNKQLTFYYTV